MTNKSDKPRGRRRGDQFYAVEKYTQAVEELDRPDGSQAERLEEAYTRYVHFVSREDMPADMRPEHLAIKNAMTSAPDAGEGTIRATINSMPQARERELVRRIRVIQHELWERMELDQLSSGPQLRMSFGDYPWS